MYGAGHALARLAHGDGTRRSGPLAALMSGAYSTKPGERVGVLLCGANVELAKLQDAAQTAL